MCRYVARAPDPVVEKGDVLFIIRGHVEDERGQPDISELHMGAGAFEYG